MKDLEKRIIQALLFERYTREIYTNINAEMFENRDYAFIFHIGSNLYTEEKPCDLTAIFEKISNDFPEVYHRLNIDEFFVDNVHNVHLAIENFVEKYVRKEIKKKIEQFDVDGKTIPEVIDFLNNLKSFADRYNSAKIPSVDLFAKDLDIAFTGIKEKLIKTGFPQFDQLLNGGYRTGISFIGAFTKVGKSCFARSLAYNVSRNYKVAYFNFEMDKHEFLRKMAKVYEVYSVSTPEEAKGKMIEDYKNTQLLILNQHSRKLQNVISTIDYLANEMGVKFFVIDTFDKLLNENDDSWFGFTKNILRLEEVALSNDVVILALKQLQVESFKWVRDSESGKHYKKKINPKCVRPSVQDSVGTKEPARTASSFITMFWDEDDWSVVNFVEQCERYNTAGLMNFKFYKETETYQEIENSLVLG